MKLFISILFLTLGQILVWFQLYGSDKLGFLKGYKLWVLYLIAIPIAFFYMNATKNGVEYFGTNWPIRILTFAIGNLVFFILSYFLMGENLNLKSGICLFLTLSIILIQILWK
jgi:hypothetical protein